MSVTREDVLAMAEDTQASLADPGNRSVAMLSEMREDVEVYRALLALDDAGNEAIDLMRAGHVMEAEQALRAKLLPRGDGR